jgi:head-tail adaptor
MSVTELITKHGVSITIQTASTSRDASGFPTLTYSNGSTVTGFIQPAGASEPLQAGRDEMVITHRVYFDAGVDIAPTNRLKFTDPANSDLRFLEVVGVIKPGMFSGAASLAHVVVDCSEDSTAVS